MKAYIYMVFIVAFIIIFQQNPMAGIIIIAIVGGGYLFIKSRKRGGKGLFRSGASTGMQDETQTILTYMLLQQLSNNNSRPHENKIKSLNEEELDEHEKARRELLKILE